MTTLNHQGRKGVIKLVFYPFHLSPPTFPLTFLPFPPLFSPLHFFSVFPASQLLHSFSSALFFFCPIHLYGTSWALLLHLHQPTDIEKFNIALPSWKSIPTTTTTITIQSKMNREKCCRKRIRWETHFLNKKYNANITEKENDRFKTQKKMHLTTQWKKVIFRSTKWM